MLMPNWPTMLHQWMMGYESQYQPTMLMSYWPTMLHPWMMGCWSHCQPSMPMVQLG
jgi:hypothetical protein